MKLSLDQEGSELLETLDVLSMPAFIADRNWTILSCNDQAPAVLEYSRAELIGHHLEQFLSLDTVLRDREASGSSSCAGASIEGKPSSLRAFWFRKNSSPLESWISVIPKTRQGPDRTLIVIRDAPGRREEADAPGPRERAVSGDLINELSGIINSSLSIGTIFRMVVSELRKIIRYNRASLLLSNETDESLMIFALDTEMKTVMKKGVKSPIDGTSAGWVVRNNKPWISLDLAETPFPLDRKLLKEGIRSTISIPLFHDRMLGVFNFDSTEPSSYSEKDLDLLLPVAKHIAIALENALLFEEISKEKKEWERTFDAFTDMVWIEDGRQRVLRANHALLARTGYSKTGIMNKPCLELLEKIGIPTGGVCLCTETLLSKQPSFRELKSGTGGIYHFWAYPLIDEECRLYALVHYLKDVTAQKRLEQQLIRTDKLASLGTLVAGIAHEINNPLGIIAGYSEALLDRAKAGTLTGVREFGDFPEYLGTIHSEIFRCKGILKSLLEFARPSAGTFREIDVNELIKEVLLLLKHRTAKLKHTIELDLNRDIPKISADAGSFRQLLMNILLNAIYFTPEGGRICIKTEPDGAPGDRGRTGDPGRVRLSVTDTGAGIPEDLIDKVFDPFFTTKPVGEGTGLGLTICHKIVEEHRGVIDAASGPGKGTTVTITLPSIISHD